MSARVALVNAPWGRIYCPSMGLGLLKARLRENGIYCGVFYLHLDWYARLRDEFGDALATSFFELGTVNEEFGEWAFSLARFGEDDPSVRKLASRLVAGAPSEAQRKLHERFVSIGPAVRSFIEEAVAGVDWAGYDVVGFTTMFSQLNASLALAERIKGRAPNVRIVFGGSRCEGEIGEGVIEGHSFVDTVFTGKPDHTVVDYVQRAATEHAVPTGVPGTISRAADGDIVIGPPERLADLSEAPLPDYDEYFERCDQIGFEEKYPKFVLVETARGCFWGVKNHCIFCGLLGERPSYTVRPPKKVIEDIDALTRKYGTHRVMFVDLIMNTKYFHEVFEWMAADERSFRFFCELKPDIKREHLKTLSEAGCWRAQPGIESFDNGVLDLIVKGTTALQNVLCLRDMRDLGMIPSWNLLYGLPTEDPAAYPAMVEKLRLLAHLEPPTSVSRMGLVRNSPALDRAAEFKLSNVRPLDVYADLFKLPPEQTRKLAYSFVADRPDGADPEEYVEPIRSYVTEWSETPERGLLAFRGDAQGGTIIDTRFNFPRQRVQLSAGEASLYAMGETIRGVEEIVSAGDVHGFEPTEALSVLNRFVHAGWMMTEDSQYLSLALMRDRPTPWFEVAEMQYEHAAERVAAE